MIFIYLLSFTLIMNFLSNLWNLTWRFDHASHDSFSSVNSRITETSLAQEINVTSILGFVRCNHKNKGIVRSPLFYYFFFFFFLFLRKGYTMEIDGIETTFSFIVEKKKGKEWEVKEFDKLGLPNLAVWLVAGKIQIIFCYRSCCQEDVETLRYFCS